MNESTSIKKEIQVVLNLMVEAFAEKNNKKYNDIFSKNSDIVIYGSQEGEKWTSIEDYMKSVDMNWIYAEKIDITYNWLSINSSGDVAWIATDLTFKSKIGEQIMSVPGRMTAVFVKENEGWKIVQSHFSMEMQSSQ